MARIPQPQAEKKSQKVAQEDSFDKLFNKLTITDKKENLDPFDQLFNNVPNQTKKKGSILSVKNHSSLSPDLSVPEEEESTENVQQILSDLLENTLDQHNVFLQEFCAFLKSHDNLLCNSQ